MKPEKRPKFWNLRKRDEHVTRVKCDLRTSRVFAIFKRTFRSYRSTNMRARTRHPFTCHNCAIPLTVDLRSAGFRCRTVQGRHVDINNIIVSSIFVDVYGCGTRCRTFAYSDKTSGERVRGWGHKIKLKTELTIDDYDGVGRESRRTIITEFSPRYPLTTLGEEYGIITIH